MCVERHGQTERIVPGAELARDNVAGKHRTISIEHEQRIVAELPFEAVGRHRPAEQIALDFVTAVLAQEVQLLMGFHAFGDHREVQAVGHGDDGAGDLRVLLAGRQAVDEGAVDLQDVDGELLEVVQR